jgi:hypothetical protein
MSSDDDTYDDTPARDYNPYTSDDNGNSLIVQNLVNGREDALVYGNCEDTDEEVELKYAEDDDPDNLQQVNLTSIRMATDNCLHKYAIDRIKGAQDNTILWPPAMLVIFRYLNFGKEHEAQYISGQISNQQRSRPYPHTNLLTERNFVMLELLLDLPIQLQIVYKPSIKLPNGITTDLIVLDLNDVDENGFCTTFDHTFSSFIEAIDLLKDLFYEGIITKDQIRKFRSPIF